MIGWLRRRREARARREAVEALVDELGDRIEELDMLAAILGAMSSITESVDADGFEYRLGYMAGVFWLGFVPVWDKESPEAVVRRNLEGIDGDAGS